MFSLRSWLALLLLTVWTATSDAAATTVSRNHPSFVNQTTCNGNTYTYQELAGYGFLPSTRRDKFGDTLGGFGSSLAFDTGSWRKGRNGVYTGIVWLLPDRGWNTEGTLNFQARVHKFEVQLTPKPGATTKKPSSPNIKLTYLDTIRFTAPDGTPCTGLDGDIEGSISFRGFPDLPVATYPGDGFGGKGKGGRRIPIDCEGLVLNRDGSFWVSDEYGPFVYKFDKRGKMIEAIRPNDAILPRRNGSVSFSADSPPVFNLDEVIDPENPDTGRANNQGFEGLTISDDGRTLYVLLQSAADQEGGLAKQTNRYSRLVVYDVSRGKARYEAEYVVPLPQFNDPTAKASKNPKTAAQSEIHHIKDGQFLVLARDSGAGHGQDSPLSVYRHADVFDIAQATNIKGNRYDSAKGAIADTNGVLKSGITPAKYCTFLDFNVNSQLNRFGVQNGGAQDATLLNEKWESLGLVPADGRNGDDDEWYLFSFSDNDFITQNGFMNGGKFPYKDSSGFDLDNQVLAFKVKLPSRSRPYRD
ncbi:MAG: hypothetical protein M4579_005966 [Chaenotheca gracillima]|nr:MAG: hypothetical protein M4579_005966 [Chaenotheca gracillima]